MLEISLLGEIVFRLHGEPPIYFSSQKEIALLAYLAHTGQTHNRETLAGFLWEARSTKQSLSNLRTALTRLRQKVGEYLVITPKTVAVTRAVHEQTDSVRFQALLKGMGKEGTVTAVTQISQGMKLYSGELMAGFSLPTAPRFNEWLVVEQERLRQTAMRGYRQLAGWQEEQGAFAAGIVTAQQWVVWDPLDETAQQQLMRLLAYNNRFSEALSVYEKCRNLLQTELGILPAPSTIALYKTIQTGSLPPPDISPIPLHNLPRALTPLFGREQEINDLTRYLINPDYPLVSVTGVGGMGKTSLVLAAGRRLAVMQPPPFKDGIWFVSLEAIEANTLEIVRDEVAALVGQAMGLNFHGESDLWAQLLGQLASKNLLLILDNIEQILTIASDMILALLKAGHNIHMLVTSRTTLALAASIAFPLTGLAIPTQVSAEALQNESVRLFAERAPAPFKLEKHLADVVAICQFVEGMPLGIELAAASLGWLMIDEIMPALTSNLRLLNSTRRDLPARQRTLHAVFDATWQLLNAHEQALLAQISIFHGGFSRLAAEAVLQDTTSGIYNLQNHALLNRDENGRFKMHPLLRQLAREKLDEPHSADTARQALNRHSRYFADFIQSFENDLQRGVDQAAAQAIFPEQANLRAAWQHAVQAGQWQTLADCLAGAHYFYKRKGLFSEEAALVDSAITSLQAALTADDTFLTRLLSRLLTVQARTYLNMAQFEAGEQTAAQACELAQKLENPDLEGQARLAWAGLLDKQNKHKLALAHYEQVVALAKIAQNEFLEADGWIGIGSQLLWQADVKPAQEPLHYALGLCQTLAYKLGEMETLIFLGDLAQRQSAFALAVEYDVQALQLSRLLGDVTAEAQALGSLGVSLISQGDLAGAQTYQEEALAVFRQLNMPESAQWMLGQLGLTAIRLGDYAAAEKHLTEGLAIARQIKDDFWQAWVKLRLGTMWHERGEAEKALPFIMEAQQVAEQIGNPRFLAAVLCERGYVLLSQAAWAQAEQELQKAHDLWLGGGQTERATSALAGLAYATYQQEKTAVAAAHAEQLWQIWQTSPPMAERADLKVYWLLGMVWDGLSDSRAAGLWQKAHALLHQRSEMIPAESERKLFLEQAPACRAILIRLGQLA